MAVIEELMATVRAQQHTSTGAKVGILHLMLFCHCFTDSWVLCLKRYLFSKIQSESAYFQNCDILNHA